MTGRTPMLIGLVAVAVAALGVDRFVLGGGTATPSTARAPKGGSVAATTTALDPGAPKGLDKKGLEQRYAPILAAKPFAVRSFRPPAPPRPRGPDRGRRDEAPPPPPGPQDLELLLCGTTGEQVGRVATVEHRASGRALFLRAGDKVGPATVSMVETAAIVLTENGKDRRVELGELLSLSPSEERRLQALRPPAPEGVDVTPRVKPGQEPPPPMDEAKKNEVLERLKARRRGQGQPPSPPAAPAPGDKEPE